MDSAKTVLINAARVFSIAGMYVASKSPELTRDIAQFCYTNIGDNDSTYLKKTDLAILDNGPTTLLSHELNLSIHARRVDEIVEKHRVVIEDNLRPAVAAFCKQAGITLEQMTS